MLKERSIALEWVVRTVSEPVITERKDDGTIHYLKSIPEHDGRTLRVVTVQESNIPRVITMFFDRRVKREL
jgi:hypothetical protein